MDLLQRDGKIGQSDGQTAHGTFEFVSRDANERVAVNRPIVVAEFATICRHS
jgi:hypothetical protein